MNNILAEAPRTAGNRMRADIKIELVYRVSLKRPIKRKKKKNTRHQT
jgi:hypothetical protein